MTRTEPAEHATGLALNVAAELLPPWMLLMRTCCDVAYDGSPVR